MLEVRVIDVRFRVPYGANACARGTGVLPELIGERVSISFHPTCSATSR